MRINVNLKRKISIKRQIRNVLKRWWRSTKRWVEGGGRRV